MQFEDLDKEDLRKLSMDTSVISQVMFATSPNIIATLLGMVGQAHSMAEIPRERIIQANLHQIIGVKKSERPEHEDLNAAIEAALMSIGLCFETVLDAVAIMNLTAKNCGCPNCSARRQIRVAGNN